MNCTDNTLDVSNLSSRKLWELLTMDVEQLLSPQQKYYVEQELRVRKHYLCELQTRQTNTLH